MKCSVLVTSPINECAKVMSCLHRRNFSVFGPPLNFKCAFKLKAHLKMAQNCDFAPCQIWDSQAPFKSPFQIIFLDTLSSICYKPNKHNQLYHD